MEFLCTLKKQVMMILKCRAGYGIFSEEIDLLGKIPIEERMTVDSFKKMFSEKFSLKKCVFRHFHPLKRIFYVIKAVCKASKL